MADMHSISTTSCDSTLDHRPKPNVFTFMAGLTKFMAAFRLSRKNAVKVFFG